MYSWIYPLGGYQTIPIGLSGKQLRFVIKNVEAFKCPKYIAKPEDFMQKINIHLIKVTQINMDKSWEQIIRHIGRASDVNYDNEKPVNYPENSVIYSYPDSGFRNFTK